MTSASAPGIGGRTLRGMAWAYGSFVGLRLSTLVTTAILARLLTPQDFGVVAVAITFMSFLEMLQGLGVEPSDRDLAARRTGRPGRHGLHRQRDARCIPDDDRGRARTGRPRPSSTSHG